MNDRGRTTDDGSLCATTSGSQLKQWERELKTREDQGEHWWELRACAYYDTFSSLGDAEEGGRLRFFTQFVHGLPIPSATENQKKDIDELVGRVLKTTSTGSAANVLELENSIDHLVFALYGLSEEEIAIVEGRDAGTKRSAFAVKPIKAAGTQKKPRKSVMTDDPNLA